MIFSPKFEDCVDIYDSKVVPNNPIMSEDIPYNENPHSYLAVTCKHMVIDYDNNQLSNSILLNSLDFPDRARLTCPEH